MILQDRNIRVEHGRIVPWLRSQPVVFSLLAVAVAYTFVFGLVRQPGYTDAFYHFNAAKRLVEGQGLTDPYLWTYLGAPPQIPAPSHLYWMPLTSLLAAGGMWLASATSYAAAQWPFALMFAGTAIAGYWLGAKLGSRRHAWIAGTLTLFSGFFTRFWGATDTFAPYAFIGSLALVAVGQMASAITERRKVVLWSGVAGGLAALAHLTRADGLLLIVVGAAVLLWPWIRAPHLNRIYGLVVLVAVYGLVMLPWFARNLALVGTPLPVGGAQAIFFGEYNDLFRYPPDVPALAAMDVGELLRARWEALTSNLATFVAVEGMIVLTPLMLVGAWKRRHKDLVRGFWLYALGLHVVMTLVFPYPGLRGGLFHSAAALIPWWAALGAVGLDDVLAWLARRRRVRPQARSVYAIALVIFAVVFSVWLGLRGRVEEGKPALYELLAAVLPADARVMINDPAQLYYYTGLGGVVLPHAAPEQIPIIARTYDIEFLVLEGVGATPRPLLPLLDAPPSFLMPLDLELPGVIVYAIQP